MLRVISQNLNGIRAAARKGWLEWVCAQGAHIICVQDLRCGLEDIDPRLRTLGRARGHFHAAVHRGAGGVAIYSTRRPRAVIEGIGDREFDAEGCWLALDFGSWCVASVLVPRLPAEGGEARSDRFRMRFLAQFRPFLAQRTHSGIPHLLCGNWQIAVSEIDLKYWRQHQHTPGFLPEERYWMRSLQEDLGWVDVFRRLDPRPGQYTWWSNRGQAWVQNAGWRIDYQLATPEFAARARRAEIYRGDRFSEHAPLIVDYAMRP